jgi:hypothetical protein
MTNKKLLMPVTKDPGNRKKSLGKPVSYQAHCAVLQQDTPTTDYPFTKIAILMAN